MNAPTIVTTINVKELAKYYYKRTINWYIAYVPLNIIEFTNWEPYRYGKNMEHIKITNTVIPVLLGSFDITIQKYQLIDGNHRCFCSNELRYTHIPAIIDSSIKDNRFIKIDCPASLKSEISDSDATIL
jgi:hypothetical protein